MTHLPLVSPSHLAPNTGEQQPSLDVTLRVGLHAAVADPDHKGRTRLFLFCHLTGNCFLTCSETYHQFSILGQQRAKRLEIPQFFLAEPDVLPGFDAAPADIGIQRADSGTRWAGARPPGNFPEL